MKPRKLKLFLGLSATLMVAVAALGLLWYWHLGKVHQHCIVAAGLAFRTYAERHGGAFPVHTNGFGDALLLLVKEGDLPGVACICGPGDDGSVLSNALAHGTPVSEEACTRIYVPGLSETNASGICLLFDRFAVRGGDHNYGIGAKLREVWTLGFGMQRITDEHWSEFARRQIELLKEAGIPPKEAERLYGLAR